MKQAKRRSQSKNNRRASGELRVVAINCNPAPDTEDRLRRLFTLLLEHAAIDEDLRAYTPANDGTDGEPSASDAHAGGAL